MPREVTLWANRLVAELRRDPLFRDVSSEAQEGGLRAALDINRAARRPARRQPPGRQRHPERRLRAAADFDHLRAGQPVSRGAGSLADVSARSVDPVETLCSGARRRPAVQRAGADVGGRDPDAHHRAAGDFASGAISGRVAELQSRARRGARRRRRCRQGDRNAHRHARQHRRPLCRRRGRVLEIAGRTAMADPGRDRHDLHRARRAL